MKVNLSNILPHLPAKELALNTKEIKLINDYINSIDFAKPKSMKTREDFLHAVAYALKNSDEQELVLDIEHNTLIVKSGLEYLLAIKMSLGTEIQCVSAQGKSIDIMKKLNISELDEEKPQLAYLMTLDDFLKAEAKYKNETNPEYQLKQLKSISEQDFISQINEIPEKLWKDEVFCTSLLKNFSKRKTSHIPLSYIISDEIIEFAKKDAHFFIKLWDSHYENIFESYQKKTGIFTDTTSIKKNIKDLKQFLRMIENNFYGRSKDSDFEHYYRELDEEHYFDTMNQISYLQQQIESTKEINPTILAQANKAIKELKAHYFQNMDNVALIIETIETPSQTWRESLADKSLQSMFSEFSKEVFTDTEMLNMLLNTKIFSKIELMGHVPAQMMKQKQIAGTFLKKLLEEEKVKFAWQDAFKVISSDKQALLDALEVQYRPSFHALQTVYEGMWGNNKLKEDMDILNQFMSLNPLSYKFMDSSTRNKEELFMTYLTNSSNIEFNLLPEKLVAKLTDDELIFKIIKTNPKSILSVSSWLARPELILMAKTDYNHLASVLEHEGVEKLMKKNESLLLRFFDIDPAYYVAFPIDFRRSENLATEYLTKAIKGINEEALPQSLFSSKAFCLKAMSFRYEFIHRTPQDFKQDMSFILKLCEQVDATQINAMVFEGVPQINTILKNNEVNSQYRDFLLHRLLSHKLEAKPVGKKLKI